MIERIVRVEWWDHAASEGGWIDRKSADGASADRAVTVGKLLNVARDRVVIAGSWCAGKDDGILTSKDQVSHITVIVRGAIIRMQTLVETGKSRKGKRQ